MTLLSVFGGGLWIIILIGVIGTSIAAYFGLRSSRSGSQQQTPGGQVYSDKNIPFYKTGGGVFAIILFIATIVAVIVMINDK